MKDNELSRIVEILAEHSLLGMLMDRQEMDQFAQSAPILSANKGEKVFEEGEIAEDLIIGLSGNLSLFSFDSNGRRLNMGSLREGRAANLYSVLRFLPFQYSGVAAEFTQFLRMPWSALKPYLARSPDIEPYLRLMTDSDVVRGLAKEMDQIGCSRQFRAAFIGSMELFKVQTQTSVLLKGRVPGFAFLLVSGSFQSYEQGDDSKIVTLRPVPTKTWQVFPECLNLEQSQFSFRSTTPCDLFRISGDSLRSLQTRFGEDFARYSDWVVKALISARSSEENSAPHEEEDQALFPELPEKKWSLVSEFPFVSQENEMDCGAACLAMISKHYRNEIPIQYWRHQIHVSRDGTSLFDLAKGAERNGYSAHGIYIEDLSNLDGVTFPFIAVRQYHYVVVYKAYKDYLIVGDPAAGIRKVPYKEFHEGFEHAALLLRPTEAFYRVDVPASTYGHYLQLFQGYGRELFLVLACSALWVLFSLFTPLLMQLVLDEVLAKKNVQLLAFALGAVAAIVVAQGVLGWLRAYYITYITSKFDFRASSAFLRKMFSLPHEFFSNRHVGDFTRRLSEMERLREFLTSTVLSTILDLLTLIVYAVVLFSYSPLIACVTLVVAPVSVGISMLFSSRLSNSYLESFAARADEESLLNDLIRGVTTIKALTGEVAARWRLEERIVRTVKSNYRFSMLSISLNTITDMYGQLSRLLIMGLAAYLGIKGSFTSGQVVSISIFVGFVIEPFHGLAHAWSGVQELRSAMARLNDIFLSPSENQSRRGNLVRNAFRGEIEFKDVWFRYGGESSEWVLKGVSFKIQPMQKVAIVGPSGSGKSTLANLLLRLSEPTQGQILVDGYDYREYDLSWLRSQMGLVLQESHLFHGTISENIAFGETKIDESRIRESAMMADAHEFIAKKPGGYSYMLAHGGIGLSGGERQRLACARVFYTNPSVLILDEATSSLDGASVRHLVRALLAASHNRTVLSIGHRYSTVRAFEHVLVMEAGKVVGFGTHAEMILNSPLYQEMFSAPGEKTA